MKRLTARDLENLLQVRRGTSDKWILPHASKCAIPVFDGLLPEPHNRRVLELLFLMAHWHSLAKLRLHTDISLAAMDRITVRLGDKLRLFQRKTCTAFSTRELNRERDARIRRQGPKAKTTYCPTTTPIDSTPAPNPTATAPPPGPSVTGSATPNHPSRHDGGRRQKTFNLNTYKFHALGDYAATIQQFGTTDSYTTEMVCSSRTPNILPC